MLSQPTSHVNKSGRKSGIKSAELIRRIVPSARWSNSRRYSSIMVVRSVLKLNQGLAKEHDLGNIRNSR